MGLDWIISRNKKSGISPCELVGAIKVHDKWPTKEAWLKDKGVQEHYRKEWLEKIASGTEDWEKEHGGKYLCDECPGRTEMICSQCTEGSFACAIFGGGGCSYRGKATAYALEKVPGGKADMCYVNRNTPISWQRLIRHLEKAIETILKDPSKVDPRNEWAESEWDQRIDYKEMEKAVRTKVGEDEFDKMPPKERADAITEEMDALKPYMEAFKKKIVKPGWQVVLFELQKAKYWLTWWSKYAEKGIVLRAWY